MKYKQDNKKVVTTVSFTSINLVQKFVEEVNLYNRLYKTLYIKLNTNYKQQLQRIKP